MAHLFPHPAYQPGAPSPLSGPQPGLSRQGMTHVDSGRSRTAAPRRPREAGRPASQGSRWRCAAAAARSSSPAPGASRARVRSGPSPLLRHTHTHTHTHTQPPADPDVGKARIYLPVLFTGRRPEPPSETPEAERHIDGSRRPCTRPRPAPGPSQAPQAL